MEEKGEMEGKVRGRERETEGRKEKKRKFSNTSFLARDLETSSIIRAESS